MTTVLETADEHISLIRAGELSGRDAGTLRVQAARGRLRTVKIGRDHLTTRRWLHEYLIQAKQGNSGRFSPLPEGYVAPDPASTPE